MTRSLYEKLVKAVEAVGIVPTAETLGALARKVLSSSRHAESRELARAVLELLARWSGAK